MKHPIPVCPNGHKPDYFLVPLYELEAGELSPAEEMVLMYPSGELTNRYDDGTAGVIAEHSEQAEEQETVYCQECLSEVTWHH